MRRFTLLIMALLLAGCSTTHVVVSREGYKVDRSVSAQGQDERVRFLVIHYTALDDDSSLKILTTNKVSAHYLIPSMPGGRVGKPVVLQLVPEEKRAWHAGISSWNGRSNLNDTSIGIEIVNRGFTEGVTGKQWYFYHPKQVDLVIRLARDIVQRYGITPDNVLAHSDIAPLRKYDPGPLFPWKMLAEQGVGAWPDEITVDKYLASRVPTEQVPVTTLQTALAKYGYTIPQTGVVDEETRKVIAAFQMHFRPSNISGEPDAQTEAIALALVEKYRNP